MPRVTVKSNILGHNEKTALGPVIQKIVAEALDGDDDESRLLPSNIEVEFKEIGPYDLNFPPVSVVVLANDYPCRRSDLQARTTQIAKALREHEAFPDEALQTTEGFVWVLLCPAGFEHI
ncbi:MAG: hypothetical protein AAB919_01210 [Patescibacteria group bacterium]